MGFIQKTWVRVLASLFAGGLASELIHISTGDPNRTRENNTSLLLGAAVISYFILTGIANKKK